MRTKLICGIIFCCTVNFYCKNEEYTISPEDIKEIQCVDSSLIPNVNVEKSFDLIKYLVRKSKAICSAYKVVPSQGAINWNANITVYKTKNNKYALEFANYIDTPNFQNIPSFVYAREIIGFDLGPIDTFYHILTSSYEKKLDSNKLEVAYFKLFADGDVSDASWEEDPLKESNYKLTSIDTVSCVVEGIFNFYFKLEHQSSDSRIKYSPLAQFVCGEFKVALQ